MFLKFDQDFDCPRPKSGGVRRCRAASETGLWNGLPAVKASSDGNAGGPSAYWLVPIRKVAATALGTGRAESLGGQRCPVSGVRGGGTQHLLRRETAPSRTLGPVPAQVFPDQLRDARIVDQDLIDRFRLPRMWVSSRPIGEHFGGRGTPKRAGRSRRDHAGRGPERRIAEC
jgi:hypothetical protein